jgi:tetratricopeptide (TPR) repeat protein
MKRLVCLILGLMLLVPSFTALTDLRRTTPPAERLGYLPSFEVAYFSSLEYRQLISELLFFNATFYYGAIMDKPGERPDYTRVWKYVNTSTRLNPYNIDSYYFGQAILTWDAGMVREMNAILGAGESKRTWDFYLPFFLGFNYSYFMNDYDRAARYMARAAELNPESAFLIPLAGRLFYQADKTDLAIQYLTLMYRGVKNEAIQKSLRVRIDALERIALLEKAVKRFEAATGHPPRQLTDLLRPGILKKIPADPYGGEFYFDLRDKRVKTTSNLAAPGARNERR